jgi:hypothetical protein
MTCLGPAIKRLRWASTSRSARMLSAMIGVFLLCVSPLHSQGNEGRILGGVTDQGGGVIPGASVTIADVQRGFVRLLLTDDSGEYNAPNLLPGAYKVRAEAKGFKVLERQNIVLEVGNAIRVDLILQPGEQTQTVLVTEGTPLTETTNATLGGALDNQTINDLPLNGRNFENLEGLRPGVTIYPGGGSWTTSTDGLRAHDNMYLVDGVNSNDPYLGMAVMNAALLAGDAGTLLPVDAIDEFRTEVNPQAEYGWRPGGVINVGLKSGTNGMHGTAYAYGRSDVFDARDYFNPASGPSAGPKTPVALEQFGASAGGPIKKDRLFYFMNFEEQSYTVGSPAHHNLPITSGAAASDPTLSLQGACLAALAPGGGGLTALSAQLAGLGGPSSLTPCAPLSGQPSNAFQGLFPVNTASSTGVNSALNSTSVIQAGLMKVDYHVAEKHQLHGSYFISPGNGVVVDDPPHQLTYQQLSDQYARAQVASGNWVWTPNSIWVNEARVGYSHYYQTYRTADASQNPAAYKFNGSTYNFYSGQTDSAYFGLPAIRITDFPNFQLGAGALQQVGPDGTLQLLDHVSVLHGKHAIKFGVEVLVLQNTTNLPQNAKGPIRFSNLQTFFNGVPNKANFGPGNYLRNISSRGYAAFLQDDWRIRPRLTVNLGLRYEINTVLKERNDLLGNFDPTLGLVQVGKGISSPFQGHHHNFSPRLGLAWDVQGDGKTVVRAGGSLIYEQLTNDVYNQTGGGGLRIIPTGVALLANGVQLQSPGTINVSSITYTGSALRGNNPGDVAYNWANNGANTPLYNISPACGDGTTEFPAGTGFFPGPCSIAAVNPKLGSPYVTTWTLGIQRAITRSMVLEAAYVGNHGTKLISLTDINEAPLGAGWTTAAIATCLNASALYQNCSPDAAAEQLARPFSRKFPYLNYINVVGNADKSNYNALQAILTQRSAHGLSFTAGYTYSHALDNSSDNFGVLRIPVTGDKQYASSDFDLRHRFTLSTTYALPGRNGFAQMLKGWSLNAIMTLQTGLPWFVQDSSNDFSGTGELHNASSELEQWVVLGNPADFTTTHGLIDSNGGALSGGAGGVPYFGPSSDPLNPSTNAACNAAARKLDGGATTGLAQAALFNTGCFALDNSLLIPPAYGTYGSSGRNIFRDTGFKNLDFSVTKAIAFKERITAQFRVEFFNVFNHPTFANPYGGPSGGSASDDPSAGPGFGCGCVTADEGGQNPVLGAGGPRAIQLGLKIIW